MLLLTSLPAPLKTFGLALTILRALMKSSAVNTRLPKLTFHTSFHRPTLNLYYFYDTVNHRRH
jgi:hypothetical protein